MVSWFVHGKETGRKGGFDEYVCMEAGQGVPSKLWAYVIQVYLEPNTPHFLSLNISVPSLEYRILTINPPSKGISFTYVQYTTFNKLDYTLSSVSIQAPDWAMCTARLQVLCLVWDDTSIGLFTLIDKGYLQLHELKETR